MSDERIAFDARVFLRVGEGDPVRLRKLVAVFLSSAQKTLGELEEALGRDDRSRAASLGHKLKSSSRWIGAMTLGERAERIERRIADADAAACQAMLESLREAFAVTRQDIAAALDAQPTRNEGGAGA